MGGMRIRYVLIGAALVVAAFGVACSDDDDGEPTPGSATDLPATVGATVSVPSPAVTVVATADADVTPGPPIKIELLADPQELACDGEAASTVTARVLDSDGVPVADGTDVTFSVQALGTADPINATTGDGEATTSVVALGEDVGVVVNVTSGDAAASIRIDCL